MVFRSLPVILSFFLMGFSGLSADMALQDDSLAMEVTLRVYTESLEVHQNRTVRLFIELMWRGDIERVEVDELRSPVLSNLKSLSNSISDQVSVDDQGKRSVYRVVHMLQPETIGMAYVEPVSITYRDNRTGRNRILRSQRIAVTVLNPLEESGAIGKVWIYTIAGAGTAGLLALGWFFFRRRRRRVQEEEPAIPLEDAFIAEMESTIPLKTTDRQDAFSALSRLFRRYISEKYSIPALELTTEALLGILEEQDMDQELMQICRSLFPQADRVKFSGVDATVQSWESAYSAVLQWLKRPPERSKRGDSSAPDA
jgi:LPXTG-motif cell wall-anchored protein